MRSNTKKYTVDRGFTLIEMSIALVIIGLLVGGVFAGEAMIRAASIRAVVTEFNRYSSAVVQFQEKYNALPGDMANATSIWGSAGGSGNDSDGVCDTVAIINSSPVTCNGDGNNQIGNLDSSYNDFAEMVRFWQHLNNAGILPTAVSGTATYNYWQPKVDAGVSKYSKNTAWIITSSTFMKAWNIAGGGFVTSYGTGHVFIMGLTGLWTSGWLTNMPPQDAQAVDLKLDDGMPATGAVIAGYNSSANNNCTTATSNTNSTAKYNLTDVSPDCNLIFRAPF